MLSHQFTYSAQKCILWSGGLPCMVNAGVSVTVSCNKAPNTFSDKFLLKYSTCRKGINHSWLKNTSHNVYEILRSTFYFAQKPFRVRGECILRIPSLVIDWETVFRLGHTPIQAVYSMICTAWTGECLTSATVSQSMTHDGTCTHQQMWNSLFWQWVMVALYICERFNPCWCQVFYQQHLDTKPVGGLFWP